MQNDNGQKQQQKHKQESNHLPIERRPEHQNKKQNETV